MSRKLLMNHDVSGVKVELPYVGDGNFQYLGDDTFLLTDSKIYDRVSINACGMLEVGKIYNLYIVILESHITQNVLDTPFAFKSHGAYATHHNIDINTGTNFVDLIANIVLDKRYNELVTVKFKCYSNTDGDRVTGLQFGGLDSGSYVKWKMWVEKA